MQNVNVGQEYWMIIEENFTYDISLTIFRSEEYLNKYLT